jgi:hypothetical protein
MLVHHGGYDEFEKAADAVVAPDGAVVKLRVRATSVPTLLE